MTADLKRLQQTIAVAHATMVDNPHRQLVPPYRLAIYDSLETERGQGDGQARLALLTARHVVRLWQPRWLGDDLPLRLLALGEGVLDGTVDPLSAKLVAEDAWTELEDLGIGRIYPEAAFFAGVAAREALMATLGRPLFGDVVISENDTDDDLDPYCSDTSHWAMRAYESIAEGELAAIEMRQEFWHWWLAEAVPQAWLTVIRQWK